MTRPPSADCASHGHIHALTWDHEGRIVAHWCLWCGSFRRGSAWMSDIAHLRIESARFEEEPCPNND